MESFFEAIHARLGLETALVCDPERAALGMQILALVGGEDQRGTGTRSITVLVGRAERLMAASLADPPSIPEIARELGAAYSHFRREFKRHTGLSPHRYINKMRLEKARRLMGVTENPLKSIADSLGFSSQYHFSSAFKRQFGVSPKAWRESGTAGGG
jgi:AraC-like DNA-binding protein